MQKKRYGRAELHRRKRRRRCLLCAAILLAGVILSVRIRAGARLCFPLDTDQWRISDGYGWRADPFTGERAFHNGIDLACAEGTKVRAALAGVVAEAARSDSYGNCVLLQHTRNRTTLYAHLQYRYVRPGEVVQKGQLLGTAGQSGRATGAHLHFELARNGNACDPAGALGVSGAAP